ncbi:hypothetical protein [Natronincola ferrireducens]|nr:hypothetical protein [Natronincola ferrireducens]
MYNSKVTIGYGVDKEGLWLKVHASRRQRDPRKITKKPVIEHGAA